MSFKTFFNIGFVFFCTLGLFTGCEESEHSKSDVETLNPVNDSVEPSEVEKAHNSEEKNEEEAVLAADHKVESKPMKIPFFGLDKIPVVKQVKPTKTPERQQLDSPISKVSSADVKPSQVELVEAPVKKINEKALMIAVAKNQCELIDGIVKSNPQILNYRTKKHKTALSVSVTLGRCLSKLLKVGAFDIGVIAELSKPNKASNQRSFLEVANANNLGSVLEFFKYVDPAELKNEVVQEYLAFVLLYGDIDLTLKMFILEKNPLLLDRVIDSIKQESNKRYIDVQNKNIALKRKRFSSLGIKFKHKLECNLVEVDFDFLRAINFDLFERRVLGKEGELLTYFEFIFTEYKYRQDYIEVALNEAFKLHPDLVVDWINSKDSFKGQNPLVAASMYGQNKILKALLKMKEIDVNVVDAKTGYNALEWQYTVNSFMLIFTRSHNASALKEKGAVVRFKKLSWATGELTGSSKSEMRDMLKQYQNPFD